MTNVTITFAVEDKDYNNYEDIIQTFLDDLSQVGIDDVEVQED